MSKALNSFRDKVVLVTGAKGFIATNLVLRLGSTGCRVIRLLRESGPPDPAHSPDVVDFFGDVTERSTWNRLPEKPDIVFHLAAQTSAYSAELNPAADWHANALPMLHLLETCREHGWHPGIFFAGSATQYGVPQRIPVDETHVDRPVTIYDHHKIVAEAYLQSYVRRGLVDGATLRLPNVYGPGPVSSKKDRGVLNLMMRRALEGKVLTLYGTGRQIRDYLFVTDAVDAFIEAAAHTNVVNGQHFVVGSGKGHSLAQAFRAVAERATLLTGIPVEVVHVDPPPGLSPIEDRDFVADNSQFHAATKWSAQVALLEGIDFTLKVMHASNGSKAMEEDAIR
jgi:UDP-glucose 4-epimerase